MTAFFVDGRCATKGSWKVTRTGHLRPDNARERPWANAVAWSAKQAGLTPTDGPFAIHIQFHIAPPAKSKYPYPRRGDADKLARSVLDALTGIAWTDDSQVVNLHAEKLWAGIEGPGAWIRITKLGVSP